MMNNINNILIYKYEKKNYIDIFLFECIRKICDIYTIEYRACINLCIL